MRCGSVKRFDSNFCQDYEILRFTFEETTGQTQLTA